METCAVLEAALLVEAALTSNAARRRHCLRLVVVLVGIVLCGLGCGFS